MNHPIKLALVILSLGGAGVQASPWDSWSSEVSVVDAFYPGTLISEMSTAFGSEGTSGILHSAAYSDGAQGTNIYYQITNDSGSFGAIGRVLQEVVARGYGSSTSAGISRSFAWLAQTSTGFGSFVDGVVKATSAYGSTGGGWDGSGSVVVDVAYENFIPGIQAGQSSYIGIVNAGVGFPAYKIGSLEVSGLEVSSLVSAVPEPEEYALMLAGMGLIGALVRRRKPKQGMSLMVTDSEGALA